MSSPAAESWYMLCIANFHLRKENSRQRDLRQRCFKAHDIVTAVGIGGLVGELGVGQPIT